MKAKSWVQGRQIKGQAETDIMHWGKRIENERKPVSIWGSC